MNCEAISKKNIINYLLSYFIPFLIMLLAIIVMRVIPFGDHNLALTDGKYYLNGLLAHARMLKGKGSLLYSFYSLGYNNWAGLSWGDFNPVKILSLFATIDTIPSWFTWISIVNMSVCGLTMYILLAGLYGHKASHLLFSTSYAMMGFNVANCFQVLFFIGPQMLPLMVLGLVRLLKGRSPLLYILSLTFCIFCNFYFGLMLCIASVIIFIAYNYVFFEHTRSTLKQLSITYIISSLIAGLLPCFFWLPALKAFSGGGRLDQTVSSEYQFIENMPFIQIFSKLFSGANSANEEIMGLPNIFCGILVVALVILFFMNRAISKRMKQAAAGVLILYLLTFYIKAFTLAMHGFTHTNWFPYRYSYVFSFFLIWIAVEEFRHLEYTTLEDTKRCGIIILITVLIVFSTSYEFISGGEVVLDLCLLTLIWFIFRKWKISPEKYRRRLGAILLLLIVCVNLFANYVISIQKLQKQDQWELDLEAYRNNTLRSGVLVDGINNYDHSFFRMEKDFSESDSVGADPLLYNYHGVSGSGPTMRMFVHKQLNKLGINWYDMRHWYSEGIPAATDTLLGLKYLLTSKDMEKEKGYKQRIDFDGSFIYQNENALSLAILANDKVQDIKLKNDAFKNLNQVWKTMTGGQEDIFSEERDVTFTLHNSLEGKTLTRKDISAGITTSKAKEKKSNGPTSSYKQDVPSTAYIEANFTAAKDGPVYYFDTAVPASDNGRATPSMKCVGVFKKGDSVVHYLEIGEDITGEKMLEYCSTIVYAYADNSILKNYAKELNKRGITFNVEKNTKLTGTFNAEANQRILFTIPWDEGWTCYIDGEKAPIIKTWDLFMSVKAPEGNHTYEMLFFPAWMNYGLMISGASLIGLVIFMIVWKKTNKALCEENNQFEQNEAASKEHRLD